MSGTEWEAIVNSIPSGVVVLGGKEGKVLYVNERAVQLYGADPRGLELPHHSTKIMRLLTLDGKVYPSENLPASRALLTGATVRDELIIERPDGSRVVVSASAKPITDGNGVVLAAVGVFEDITERKQGEEQRRKILESITDGFVAFDRDWRYTYVNSNAAEMLHRSKDDLLGSVVWEVFPEASKLKFFEKFSESVNSDSPVHFEEYYPEPLNVWFECSCFPSEDGLTVFFSDITDRKRTEEALFESVRRYRRLFETSIDGIIARNSVGELIDCNQAYAQMVGYTKEEIAGMSWAQLIPDEFCDQRERIAGQVLKTGIPAAFEREYVRKDGTVFPASVNTWPLTDDQGKIAGTWSIVRDISKQKELQKRLEKHSVDLEALVGERTKQLRDAERLAAIGATAAMVGHDIRNPLQAIASDVYLAKSDLQGMPGGVEKEGLLESLVSIQQNVDYINKIVQDLQDYARPIRPVLGEVAVEEMCELLLFNSGVPESVAPSLFVRRDAQVLVTDAGLLKRVLTNLISNAIQAMPQGGKLSVSALRKGEDVVISVEDTGCGIPEEVRGRLFTPLFTTKSKGQGFGLAVVKRLTEALGGSVSVESEVGRGTKFILRFPRRSE